MTVVWSVSSQFIGGHFWSKKKFWIESQDNHLVSTSFHALLFLTFCSCSVFTEWQPHPIIRVTDLSKDLHFWVSSAARYILWIKLDQELLLLKVNWMFCQSPASGGLTLQRSHCSRMMWSHVDTGQDQLSFGTRINDHVVNVTFLFRKNPHQLQMELCNCKYPTLYHKPENVCFGGGEMVWNICVCYVFMLCQNVDAKNRKAHGDLTLDPLLGTWHLRNALRKCGRS